MNTMTWQNLYGMSNERTSGSIEAWNYILKQVDHKKSRMQQDLFIKEHLPVLRGRQVGFVDALKFITKKQKSNKSGCIKKHNHL